MTVREVRVRELGGDDGQHDPQLYDELVADAAGRVPLIAIRRLSLTEQVLTHGTPLPKDVEHRIERAPNG
jgi:phosphatidate phosphatase APP1